MADGIVTKSVIWSAVERFSTIGVQFILNIIIARILSPSDYGIIGMLAIFLSVSQCLIDSGFSTALVQSKDRKEKDYGTVFVFNLIISVFIYLILYVSAPTISKFYQQDILVCVLRIVGLNLIISSISNVHRAILTIKIDFKTQSFVSIPSALISGVVGVIMAHKGFGVWALVGQTLSNGFITTLLFWVLSKERFRIVFDVSSFKRLGGFGVKLMFSGLLNTAYTNLYGLFIGKKYNADDLGYYTRAEQFSIFPATILTDVVTRVAFPLLCQNQENKAELSRVYTTFIKSSCFIMFPLMIGLSVLSKPLVVLLLTEKWISISLLMSILALDCLFAPITRINLQLLQAVGRSDLFLRLEIIKKSVSIAILLITINYGLVWICIGRLIYSVFALLINMYYTVDIIGKSYFEQIKDWLPNFIVSVIMGVLVYFSTYMVIGSILKILVGGIVGVLSYFALSSIFKLEAKDTALNMMRRLLRKA
ncbi:MAG: lipopolysaccharide biosynthesis protein [Alphaproteobacteria bacterium]|nr:lipopolysaccharide biosynthesis protein [Alphaproteobacteria bacterium]